MSLNKYFLLASLEERRSIRAVGVSRCGGPIANPFIVFKGLLDKALPCRNIAHTNHPFFGGDHTPRGARICITRRPFYTRELAHHAHHLRARAFFTKEHFYLHPTAVTFHRI